MIKKDRWKDWLLFILAIFILFLMIKYSNIKPKIEYIDRVKIDTMFIEKIIKDTLPKYITKEVIRNETIYVNDSIFITLPIEQKTYENQVDSTLFYKAFVSGYNAKLDSILFQMNYPIIKEIQYVKEPTNWFKEHFYYGIGVGAGYGIINKNLDIYIGGSVGFKF